MDSRFNSNENFNGELGQPEKKNNSKNVIIIVIVALLVISWIFIGIYIYNSHSKVNKIQDEDLDEWVDEDEYADDDEAYTSESSEDNGLRKLKLKANDGICEPLAPQGSNTYHASNLVDGNTSKAWAIDLNNEEYDDIWGPNITVKDGKKIDHIVIYNGYCKNSESFNNNSRPAWICIYRPIEPDTGDPEPQDILYAGPLKDTSSPQRLKVNPDFDFSEPIGTLTIKLRNGEGYGFYPGAKWSKDLLISEIEFWGK